MTTLQDTYPEPEPREISKRLSMHMGDKKISRNKLAMTSGMGRTALSQKLDDQSDFTIDELMNLSHTLGVDWLWILTGTSLPGGPNGTEKQPVGQHSDVLSAA